MASKFSVRANNDNDDADKTQPRPPSKPKRSYSLVAYRDEPAGLQKVVRDKVETVLEVIPNVSHLFILIERKQLTLG